MNEKETEKFSIGLSMGLIMGAAFALLMMYIIIPGFIKLYLLVH